MSSSRYFIQIAKPGIDMLILYVDMLSQPARACVLFCRLNGLKVDECMVDVTAGETRSKGFVKINPMFEGDPQGCARVNSALDWYHGNVRLPAIKLTWYVMAQTMQHIDKTKHVNEYTAHDQLAVLHNTLKMMEEVYLAENKFLAGNSISIADLLYSCELDEMQLLDSVEQLPTYKELLQPFPKVQGWMTRVAHTTSPHWTAVTAAFQEVADHGREKRQQAIAARV